VRKEVVHHPECITRPSRTRSRNGEVSLHPAVPLAPPRDPYNCDPPEIRGARPDAASVSGRSVCALTPLRSGGGEPIQRTVRARLGLFANKYLSPTTPLFAIKSLVDSPCEGLRAHAGMHRRSERDGALRGVHRVRACAPCGETRACRSPPRWTERAKRLDGHKSALMGSDVRFPHRRAAERRRRPAEDRPTMAPHQPASRCDVNAT
jgi:hypothetical protein